MKKALAVFIGAAVMLINLTGCSALGAIIMEDGNSSKPEHGSSVSGSTGFEQSKTSEPDLPSEPKPEPPSKPKPEPSSKPEPTLSVIPELDLPSAPDLSGIEFVIPPEDEFKFINAGADGGFWMYEGFEKNIELPAELGGAPLTKVFSDMFSVAPELEYVKIPDGVTKVEAYAFYSCDKLEGLIIPESVKNIDIYAFGGCKRLKAITIPNGVTVIGEGAFYDCAKLKSVVLPKGAVLGGGTIRGLFENCTSLLCVDLGGVNYIGGDTFKNCGELRRVYISDKTRYISNDAFKDCPNVEVVYDGGFYSGDELKKLIDWINKG